MSHGPLISVRDLSFSYPDGHQALRDVSLDMKRGEKVALVGPNGAGKSTLLLHLNGLLNGQGIVEVDGQLMCDANVRVIRGKVGLVFQNPEDQLFSPTVFDDVAFGPLNMGLPDHQVRDCVQWALEQVGMGAYGQRMPHHLSLGEQKRVAIATVLSMAPDALALDEPFAGLDPAAREQLIDLLIRLPQTMLIASHDLDAVRRVCQRVVVLDCGQVTAHLMAEELSTDVLWSPGHRPHAL